MEFHVSRTLRDRLNLDELLFSYRGNVVFANLAASRKLAKQLNDANAPEAGPESQVNAGALFAMGLIDELSHAIVARYRKEIDPAVFSEAARWFGSQASPAALDKLLLTFAERFPNTAVYRGEVTSAEWLKGTTEGVPNRDAALEELLLLWLANINPAFMPFRILFEDEQLGKQTIYQNVTTAFPEFFATRPPLAGVGSLLDALRAPMLASPRSLTGQLDFIREHWAKYVDEDLRRVLLAIDVMREEDIAIWMRFNPPGPDRHRHGEPGWGAQGFVGDEFVGFDDDFVLGADGVRRRRQYPADHQAALHEYEAFSPDQAWMPNVVLMAKSTYVWLEQLSKKYGRHIHRLDQIPDDELQLLASRGITALWLIGLWERSVASQTIKRMRGHTDAVASAYSLKEYQIAEDLGGTAAYEHLRDRAAAFRLRLASDMVPNHMGIDSTWVIEHPEWFISRLESPFPVYAFHGPDLSTDHRVEIKIEDHYFDQTDAAVAFRLRQHRDGSTRYVYHGNDGTTFAWNDTAQLDYSKAAVREHVIQTILHVARLFPIIRFDAAMTLAKRHVQRLWFPLPGVGGSIPSRAESAMSQEEFDALMPNEFWREVVDRVAVEVPGTLLLAEAFWLLESYFVRTLGMHRVYNSAFMNMLRDEENAKYRSYLKKTIEFDPDILKRYVNFMSNPDERTAIDQFGSGDKFFGTCTLLATLPGLPMFGHGQIEGFTERYGMEFKRARLDENPNEDLVARHQHEIAPLLKNRQLFADSTNFVLYDFWTGHDGVDENVFAYSNRSGDQRAVILYNNSYGSTHGTIRISAASMNKYTGSLRQKTLAEGLGLTTHQNVVIAYRDMTHNLEYFRRATDLGQAGLTFGLRGYQHVVLQNWRELWPSTEQPWDSLCDDLNGAGVQNADEALARFCFRPLHEAFNEAISRSSIQAFSEVARELVEKAGGRTAKALNTPGAMKDELEVPKQSLPPAGKRGEEVPVVPVSKAEGVIVDPRLNDFIERSDRFFHKIMDRLPRERREMQQGSFTESTLDSQAGGGSGKPAGPKKTFRELCERKAMAAVRLPLLGQRFSSAWPVAAADVLPGSGLAGLREGVWGPVLAWILLSSLPWEGDGAELLDRFQLKTALAENLSSFGIESDNNWRAASRVRILLAEAGASPAVLMRSKAFWNDAEVRWLAGMSEAFGISYLNKERFEALVVWLNLPELIEVAQRTPEEPESLAAVENMIVEACEAATDSEYKLNLYLGKGQSEKHVERGLAKKRDTEP